VEDSCSVSYFSAPDFFAMPVIVPVPIRQLSQQEFGDVAFEVMRHAFAIHNEIGRFFDEKIYKHALARRLPGVQLEVPIDVTFRSFQKRYFLDVLAGDGAIFEFKAVETLTNRHRAQLLQYLLLCDVAHGKVINVRSKDVQHEFVNTHWRQGDRIKFAVRTSDWNAAVPGAARFPDLVIAMLRDLGAGLGIALYEEAILHLMEGTIADIAVKIDGHGVGQQRVRLLAPGVALKVTGLNGPLEPFEDHARRLLAHVDVRAIAWVNVNMKEVTFTTLEQAK
jgi:GxxExxY protein